MREPMCGCGHRVADHSNVGCTVDWVHVGGQAVVDGCPCESHGPIAW